ncbi:MAG: transporter [Magnetococcales bacterium]|nr:transporter [Magnetococcales bacterium]
MGPLRREGGRCAQRLSGMRSTGMVLLCLALAGCAVWPEPITLEEKKDLVVADRVRLFMDQEPVTGPITLKEAMARALKYNMNHRLQMMEEALSQKQLDLTKMSMLPALAANAGFSDRNNLTSSLGTGSLEPSTSTDRSHLTADLTTSWNILDFGVSYFQAKQDADRVLIAAQRYRKVEHNLMREVRFAWWKVLSAQLLEPRLKEVLSQTETAMENSGRMETDPAADPAEALKYQRTLVEILRQMQTIRTELEKAKTELAVLMNLPPGSDYQLSVREFQPTAVLKLSIPIEKMEEMALMQLPELWEENYQSRITVMETKKAIARMFPGISIGGGANYDSNSYYVNQQWWSVSTQLSWNLLNLISAPRQLAQAEASETLAETRRLSLSMAALSQVHIAWQNYRAILDQLRLIERLDGIDQRLEENARNQQLTQLMGLLEPIRASAQALATRMIRNQTYAQLQDAIALIHVSTGHDPLPETLPGTDLATLGSAIDGQQRDWEKQNGTRIDLDVPRKPSPAMAPVADKPLVSPREVATEHPERPVPDGVWMPGSEEMYSVSQEGRPEKVLVNIEQLNLRTMPQLQGRILKPLSRSTALKVDYWKNGWLLVEDPDGVRGWVAGYLTWDPVREEKVTVPITSGFDL